MEENQMTLEEFQSLINELEATPRVIQQLADELNEGDARWKPTVEEWSVLEHVCHLKDIEQEGYTVRIRKLLHETQPYLTDIDGAQLALTRNYNSQDFDTALRAFALARQQNVLAIRDVPLDRLEALSGTFENVGQITLGKLLLMMREHDQGHLEDIHSLRERLRRMHAPLKAAS
jgi:hypothetical protein